MNAPRDWTLLCLSCGAVVALSRLFSCSWVPVPGPGPGYLGTWVPGYLGTWVPGYLGTWVPGYLGTWVPGYLGTWVPGHLGTWAPGHLGVPVGPQGPAVGLRGPTVSPTVGPPRTPTKGSDISRTDCTVQKSSVFESLKICVQERHLQSFKFYFIVPASIEVSSKQIFFIRSCSSFCNEFFSQAFFALFNSTPLFLVLLYLLFSRIVSI